MKCVNGERYCEWHSEFVFFFIKFSNILRYFNINVIIIPLSPGFTSALICFHFRRVYILANTFRQFQDYITIQHSKL